MPKHVMFFLPSLGPGGAETHAIRLANHLDRERFRVSVTVARGGGGLEERVAPDVVIHRLAPAEYRSSLVSMARAVSRLARALATERPDILMSFVEHAGVAGTLAASRAAFPGAVVLGIQNTLSRALQRQGNSRDLTRATIRYGVGRLYPRAAGIVASCRGVAEDAARLFPRLTGRVTVIHNAGYDDAVDQGRILASRIERPPAPLFVACGRLDEQKGYAFLLQAFSRLLRQRPAHLWIIGQGPLERDLKSRAQRLGIDRNVRFLGFQSNPYGFMAAADVFVLPSLYEGFGNVLVEAMACGTAVVATDCPHGPGEIIQDGVNGRLVPPADERALASAMLRLLDDADLRALLARNAPARASDFHAREIASRYGAFFESLETGVTA